MPLTAEMVLELVAELACWRSKNAALNVRREEEEKKKRGERFVFAYSY